MKTLFLSTLAQWRAWLEKNHLSESEGVWLGYYRKETGRPSLDYGDSVEEALCYGWVDSIIRKIDGERYCRKFTPRKPDSRWSALNRKRVEKLIREGRMAAPGLARVADAKRTGAWAASAQPPAPLEFPEELSRALRERPRAKAFFDSLAPGYQNQFIGWVGFAKRPETRIRRAEESVALLERGEKLGLK